MSWQERKGRQERYADKRKAYLGPDGGGDLQGRSLQAEFDGADKAQNGGLAVGTRMMERRSRGSRSGDLGVLDIGRRGLEDLDVRRGKRDGEG